MKYDKYVGGETLLNCYEQNMLDYLFEIYVERILHELKLLTGNEK